MVTETLHYLLEVLIAQHAKHPQCIIHDGYLLQGTQVCVPSTSIHEHIVQELQGRLSEHMVRDKTLAS